MALRLAVQLCIVFFSASICADPEDTGNAMSLETVYQLAVGQAPSLAVAQYRLEAAEAQAVEARGAVLPQVSIFGEWSDNSLEYDGGALAAQYGKQRYPGERYGLQIRQTLFNMAAFREAQRRRALSNRSASDLDLAEIELLIMVTDAYLTALISENTVNQFQAESEALASQLEAAKALYARSLVPLTQVLETETRAATVRADVIEAEGDAAIAREQLTELIGARDFQLMPIAPAVKLSASAETVDVAVARALENSPAVSSAGDSVKAAEFGVKREKGSWFPEVDLVFNQQYSDVGFDNLTSPPRTTESVSIAVNYPLIQGGSGSARIRGAWAEYYAVREELEGIKRSVETQTRSAWVRFSAANKRAQAAEQALEASRINVFATQKSVKAGTARVTDVLFALAQRTRAERDRFFAEQQRILAWLDLELMVGEAPNDVAALLSDALLTKAAISAAAMSR